MATFSVQTGSGLIRVGTVGPTFGDDEGAWWRDRAAMLDPAAYALLSGAVQSTTVTSGQTWYLVGGWQIDVGSTTLHHRKPDVLAGNVVPLKSGTVLTTENNAGAHAWICKPSLVTSDARYTDDPRGLFFERLRRIDTELTHYDIGHTNTGTTGVTTSFPTDFTEGLVVHASAHDVAWSGFEHSSAAFGFNFNNEISDDSRIRFAERVTVPFDRTVWPKVKSQGANQVEGVINIRYIKLPVDW